MPAALDHAGPVCHNEDMKRLLFPLAFLPLLALALLIGCAAPQRAPFSPESDALLASFADWGPKADAAHVAALEAAARGDCSALSDWRGQLLRPDGEVAFNAAHAGRATLRFEGPWAVYAPAGEPKATVLYLHGGGWAVGDARLCEGFCAGLAERAQAEVWSLNYPLAPEHPFPAAPRFAAERLNALRARFPGRPLYVAGDSAGGNLAVAAALLAPGQADGLILAYPALAVQDKVAPEGDLYGDVLALTDALMSAFGRLYVDAATAAADPVASPLAADDGALRALPPVLTLAAECDVLAGQSRVFHERLAALGRTADARHVVPGSLHGFLSFPTLTAAQGEALGVAVGWIEADR